MAGTSTTGDYHMEGISLHNAACFLQLTICVALCIAFYHWRSWETLWGSQTNDLTATVLSTVQDKNLWNSCIQLWTCGSSCWGIMRRTGQTGTVHIYIFFFSETNQGCWGFFQSVEHWRSAAAFAGPSSNSLSETSPVHQMICVSVVCRCSDTMRQTRMLCPPSDWRHASLPAGRMSSWPNPWYGFLGMYHFLFTCCVRSDL